MEKLTQCANKEIKMKPFPKKIFVTWEDQINDDPYLIINESPETTAEVGQSIRVAEYELEKTVYVTTKVEIQD